MAAVPKHIEDTTLTRLVAAVRRRCDSQLLASLAAAVVTGFDGGTLLQRLEHTEATLPLDQPLLALHLGQGHRGCPSLLPTCRATALAAEGMCSSSSGLECRHLRLAEWCWAAFGREAEGLEALSADPDPGFSSDSALLRPCQEVLPRLDMRTAPGRAALHHAIERGQAVLLLHAAPGLVGFDANGFLQRYGATADVQASSIPYGEVFGRPGGRASLLELDQYMQAVFPSNLLRGTAWPAAADQNGLRPAPCLPSSEGLFCLANVTHVCQRVVPNGTWYAFDTDALSPGGALAERLPSVEPMLLEVYRRMGFSPARLRVVRQFYFGPPCSGAPWHYHYDAFNVLLRGRKLWWLQAPGASVYGTALATEAGVPVEREAALACEQRAGEVLFVPRQSGHRTLNVAAALGFALELATSATLPDEQPAATSGTTR